MIKVEYLNNKTLIKHFSDSGVKIIQNETGELYHEAIDPVPCQYTYSESDQTIEEIEYESEVEEKAAAYDILMGVI